MPGVREASEEKVWEQASFLQREVQVGLMGQGHEFGGE